MNIQFYKYHGTGNDFILVKDWDGSIEEALDEKIAHLCHRRFGIGADGFIFLQKYDGYDFYMRYYNSDGKLSTMCGNGGRCITSFANKLGIIDNRASFMAVDGPHDGTIDQNIINLKMSDVNEITEQRGDYILDTGSPHYVKFVADYNSINVNEDGKQIRFSEDFKKDGINVNFVELSDNAINVATYERGVEGETLSCGTGVTAAALAAKVKFPDRFGESINVNTKGGKLEVKFSFVNGSFTDIWLCGPVVNSFNGVITL